MALLFSRLLQPQSTLAKYTALDSGSQLYLSMTMIDEDV